MNGEIPNCPVCNRPVRAMTVRGPTEATVEPCGHKVDPTQIDNQLDESKSPTDNVDGRKRQHNTLLLETAEEGELAAAVTISGLGHDASPAICECIEDLIEREAGHLIREY